MRKAARLPLSGGRYVPFARTIAFEGIDLSAAAFHAQVRAKPGAEGDPLVDLVNVADGSNGVRILGVDNSGASPITTIQLQISQAVMTGMPLPIDGLTSIELAWDLVVTPAGGAAEVWLYGEFVVVTGVTR